MCLILIKPAGVSLPATDILEKAAYVNHDGYGFVTSKGKACKTTNYRAFISQLQQVKKDEACLIHMRWATHGSKTTKNCHPFYDKDTKVWFAHNGVLPIPSKHDMTDSEICFRETLVPAIKKYGFGSERFCTIEDNARGGSRFAYMKDGRLYMSGDFIEHDGCYYSNMHFAGIW